MTNNKQQTAVDILCGKLAMKLGIPQAITFYIDHQEEIKEAKEMEKQQTRDDIKNELKLIGNYFDVGKLDQREQGHHIRFTSILKDRFDFYNETNGGNK
jgi:hypothetical protein